MVLSIHYIKLVMIQNLFCCNRFPFFLKIFTPSCLLPINFENKNYRTIWPLSDFSAVEIIDQTKLPFKFETCILRTVEDFASAIQKMLVRGAGLIGSTAAWAMYISVLTQLKDRSENWKSATKSDASKLKRTRPTAVNLEWAVNQQISIIENCKSLEEALESTRKKAIQIWNDDADMCKKIGEHGLELIREIQKNKINKTVNVLTHCNAGWLAFVDYGSATSPIYAAFDQGIDIHVWVDETRPRNQGARLTAWELGEHGVPHTIIVDNAGGHLMQHGMVDLVLVGSDRTTGDGDVCNKIGTYLKALSARDNNIPFYAAMPSSTIDWNRKDGHSTPIEIRASEEIKYVEGLDVQENLGSVLISPTSSNASNFAFDVTPARLVTGIITERGIAHANRESLEKLHPEIS